MTAQTKSQFYGYFSWVLLALVLAGFVPAGFMRPGGVTAAPLLLHVHGAVFLAWFLLLCLQLRLITTERVGLHQALGKSSVILAVAMVVLGYLVIRSAYAKPEFSIAGMTPAASVMFPFTDIVNFVIAYALGLLNRRNAQVHKRFMILAGVLILDPAISRLVITIGGPPPLILVLELGIFGALLIHDWRTLRRPHWATLTGLALFVLAMLAKLLLAPGPQWQRFVETAFG